MTASAASSSTLLKAASASENRLTPYDFVVYAVLVLSWSASWYALALQVGNVPVQTSLFWRFAIAASIMWIWVLASRKPVRFPVRLHIAFAGMGLFIFCLNFMLFYYGSSYLISGLLSVVFSLASVFNLALGFVLERRLPRARVLGGAFSGVVGIAFMFWPEIANQSWQGGAIIGLGLCIAGTLSFCIGSQISAQLQRKQVPLRSTTAWGMTYGTLFSGLIGISLGNSFAIEWSAVYLGSLLFLAVVSSVIAFWAFLTLVGRIGAGRSGYATVMFPVLALVISAIFEGYTFPAVAMLGLAMVLIGNMLVLGGGNKA
ncbi:MAG: DMT family transporter [Pseudomonadota bacterium]